MPILTDDVRKADAAPLDDHFQVELSRSELALIIGALLQAEATLPLVDSRYASLKCLAALRAQQLSLANRLEDQMADLNPPCPANAVCAQPWQDRSQCIPSASAQA